MDETLEENKQVNAQEFKTKYLNRKRKLKPIWFMSCMGLDGRRRLGL